LDRWFAGLALRNVRVEIFQRLAWIERRRESYLPAFQKAQPGSFLLCIICQEGV
jgi:hypothetical protein